MDMKVNVHERERLSGEGKHNKEKLFNFLIKPKSGTDISWSVRKISNLTSVFHSSREDTMWVKNEGKVAFQLVNVKYRVVYYRNNFRTISR